jgi:inner membrane transporter RhtA
MATTLRAPRAEPLSRVPSPALVIGAIGSVQFGAALAITVFDRIGASGTVMLRLISASLVLTLLSRAQLRRLTLRQLRLPILFGVVLAVMNLAFYASIARIPLGIAVAIEFLGPLAVALGGSRRRLDVVWVVLAAAGVVALAHGSTHSLNLAGVLFAALAGLAWGAYILLNVRLGRTFADGSGLAVAMCVAAILTLPLGITAGGAHLLEPHVLLVGGAVGILSSAIPYSLEMEALRRIRPEVFGVLMSIEPAVAALAGFVVVGQGLSARELGGIVLVGAASAGSALRSRAPVAIDDAGIG